MDFALLVVGGVCLYFGAEWLVAGASRLALSMGIPQLLIGLTVVAYGTSTPEIVVGIQAALSGQGDVALGNVIGSNIANIGLILGAAVLLKPARVDPSLRRRELPVLGLATLSLPLMLLSGYVMKWHAALLLVAALAYSAWMIRGARSPAHAAAQVATAKDSAEAATLGAGSRLRHGLLAALGLGVLLVGGQSFVTGAVAVGRDLGLSDRIIGLTIVAVGTSLPELATSLLAAARGHSDIAIGNVVGSNIFNLLLCLGASGLAGTIRSNPAVWFDLLVLCALTAFAAFSLRKARTVSRIEGALMLGGYAAYLTALAAT
jgi:cation:H+ antiporter